MAVAAAREKDKLNKLIKKYKKEGKKLKECNNLDELKRIRDVLLKFSTKNNISWKKRCTNL